MLMSLQTTIIMTIIGIYSLFKKQAYQLNTAPSSWPTSGQVNSAVNLQITQVTVARWSTAANLPINPSHANWNWTWHLICRHIAFETDINQRKLMNKIPIKLIKINPTNPWEKTKHVTQINRSNKQFWHTITYRISIWITDMLGARLKFHSFNMASLYFF